MAKTEMPFALLERFYYEALEGNGRERDVGGGNTSVEITVLRADLEDFPEMEYLRGHTIKIVLNRMRKMVGWKVIKPRRKGKK